MTRFSFLGALVLARSYSVPDNFLQRVEPVLNHLADLDPSAMDFLATAIDMESQKIEKNTLFLQSPGPDVTAALGAATKTGDIGAILGALAPLLAGVGARDKGQLDSVMGLMGALGKKKSAPEKVSTPTVSAAPVKKKGALLQMVSTPAMQARLAVFAPIYHKIRNMDEGHFGNLQQLLHSETGLSLLQLEDHPVRMSPPKYSNPLDTISKTLDQVKGMDPMAAALLEGLLGKMRKPKGAAFLQIDPLVEEKRLSKIGPILLRLSKIDAKRFGGLNKLVSVAEKKATDEATR